MRENSFTSVAVPLNCVLLQSTVMLVILRSVHKLARLTCAKICMSTWDATFLSMVAGIVETPDKVRQSGVVPVSV